MKQKGFTLIELILVTAVMGILIVGVLLIFNPLDQIAKSNDTSRKSDLVQMQRLLETYYQDNGRYPSHSATYTLNNLAGVALPWGSSFQPYMNVLPADPRYPDRTYIYYAPTSQAGQTYYLYASLERGAKDAQACNRGSVCTNVPTNVRCGGTNICNFGVSSPNVTP